MNRTHSWLMRGWGMLPHVRVEELLVLLLLQQMKAPFSGIVRVAVLPHPWDDDSEQTLSKHAYAYPRGGQVSFAVDGDEMEIK